MQENSSIIHMLLRCITCRGGRTLGPRNKTCGALPTLPQVQHPYYTVNTLEATRFCVGNIKTKTFFCGWLCNFQNFLWVTFNKNKFLWITLKQSDFFSKTVTHKQLVSLSVTQRKLLCLSVTHRKLLLLKVTHRKFSKLHSYPQKKYPQMSETGLGLSIYEMKPFVNASTQKVHRPRSKSPLHFDVRNW